MHKSKVGIWLTASALGALLPFSSALAADMPVKAKPIVAAAFDWSGVYVGVHAGYGGGMKDWEQSAADFVARGPLVGGQVGINKQLGSFVFGLELDGAWADIKGSQTVSLGDPILGVQISQTSTSKIDGIATLAGRAGLAFDRWFVFAKGGLAALHETHSQQLNEVLNGRIPTILAVSFAGNEVRYAPMLGFGTEYALGNNWSIKGEYDYIHVNARAVTLNGTFSVNGVAGPASTDVRTEQAIHLAKLGVNYRWGNVAVDPSFTPVPPAPGTNWSGGYIGAEAGYGWGTKRWPSANGPFNAFDPVDYDMKGWLAGGTIGANAQAGSFVFGVEGEILGTGIRGSQTAVVTPFVAPGGTQTTTFDSKIDWLALATARAGFVVGSNLLLYGKGGVAIAQETHNISVLQSVPAQGTVTTALTAKPVHTGVVVGAGGEYAFASNWSVKLEYDFIRMFQQSVTANGFIAVNTVNVVGTDANLSTFSKVNQDLHLVKVGVNYHFNPVPVVVAKY